MFFCKNLRIVSVPKIVWTYPGYFNARMLNNSGDNTQHRRTSRLTEKSSESYPTMHTGMLFDSNTDYLLFSNLRYRYRPCSVFLYVFLVSPFWQSIKTRTHVPTNIPGSLKHNTCRNSLFRAQGISEIELCAVRWIIFERISARTNEKYLNYRLSVRNLIYPRNTLWTV